MHSTRDIHLVDADAEGQIEEQSLLQSAIKRDRDAFGRLYDLHISSIYKHIYYRIGKQSDAEDLCAEVFLRAWKAIDKYNLRGVPFRGWLFRIANNLIIDRHRTTRQWLPLDEVIADPGAANDPVAVAEINLDRDQLRRAILLLKPEHQQVIILRFVDELDHSEVAAIVGKSEGAVRVIQYRALKELRDLLEGDRIEPKS